jgi:hypothetical protein
MKKTEDGTYRIDPTPEIEVYVTASNNIGISIELETLVIPARFAQGIATAIANLSAEIRDGKWDEDEEECS